MALTATISGDCKILTIAGGADYANADVDIYWNDVTISSIPRETSAPYNPILSLTSAGDLILSLSNFIDDTGASSTTYTHFNGIFKIVVTTATGTHELGAVGMCDINCCLAAKTKELLNCKCTECKECASILADIAKIFLLLQGAKTNVGGCVQTTTLYEKSIDEYLKAKEICGVQNCNCDC
mgnify:CR=1 FL=1|tara:strand:- start:861 stop:1406 length:546 start_codon:yes stop_codon:yes gene_type:complete